MAEAPPANYIWQVFLPGENNVLMSYPLPCQERDYDPTPTPCRVDFGGLLTVCPLVVAHWTISPKVTWHRLVGWKTSPLTFSVKPEVHAGNKPSYKHTFQVCLTSFFLRKDNHGRDPVNFHTPHPRLTPRRIPITLPPSFPAYWSPVDGVNLKCPFFIFNLFSQMIGSDKKDLET